MEMLKDQGVGACDGGHDELLHDKPHTFPMWLTENVESVRPLVCTVFAGVIFFPEDVMWGEKAVGTVRVGEEMIPLR